MANKRKYAYYLKGNKIAIIEEGQGSGLCSISDYKNKTDCEANNGTWTENATGNDDGKYKSPIADITDGLEIQYAYSPTYHINDADITTSATGYTEDGNGFLQFQGSFALTAGDYIVVSNSEKWNGLHEVSATVSANNVVTKTKYNGAEVTIGFTVSTDVAVLEDETFELDLTRYQANAVVYFVKAKIAEDMGDMEQREFFLREFKRQLEKGNSAFTTGVHIVQGYGGMR